MFLLIGGDSELGAATYRYLERSGFVVEATTRRRNSLGPGKSLLDLSAPMEDWKPPRATRAAGIFAAVARLVDCAADPVGSARINVTQTLALVDKLTVSGIFVIFLSTNQVFDGTTAHVPADAPTKPVSEYGRQKAQTEAAIKERMSKGLPLSIFRVSKTISPDMNLVRDWIDALKRGHEIQAFVDMTLAPVSVDIVSGAIALLLRDQIPGIYQLSGPRDVSYADVAHFLARQVGADSDLVKPISAYSVGMPVGTTPQNTTLDTRLLSERYGIVVPDIWETLSALFFTSRG
jgi:dTDP-4-dehydrorhamnose reductase